MTGARFVHDRFEELGWDVLIADAAKVKGLAPLACETDRIDARVLAVLPERDLVPEIWLPDPRVRRERRCATACSSRPCIPGRASNTRIKPAVPDSPTTWARLLMTPACPATCRAGARVSPSTTSGRAPTERPSRRWSEWVSSRTSSG